MTENGAADDAGLKLFLVGFLVLFLELACIRWFATYVIFLQFFTNVVLLASFLGMSCGCMVSRGKRDWLAAFPLIAFGSVAGAILMLAIYDKWSGLAITVGNQVSPQEVFYGTEYRNPDVAEFVVPIDVIVGLFFVLIALMFVGLGQALGRAFDAYPNRVIGYALNIGGSLAGIILFSLISFLQAPPAVWFLVSCGGIAYLLRDNGTLTPPRALLLAGIVGIVFIVPVLVDAESHGETRWSPYYAVNRTSRNQIMVNTISHQRMEQFNTAGAQYSLIHLLQRETGGKPFENVLIIGAGSGNDVDHALHYGVKHVDAVEIDPVIQDMGVRHNPDHPYQDPRVERHLDDGRHFLRTTGRKYDLVIYGLVDSLVLHSGYSNIRLESYLFTQQAFEDVKRVLKPGGTFVTYNYFRQGWVVQRVAAMAKHAFGCDPIVLSLPYKARLMASAPTGFTMVVTSCNTALGAAFRKHPAFWLDAIPNRNTSAHGFFIDPARTADPQEWLRVAPTTLIADQGPVAAAEDDWPFPYLHGPMIPELSIRSMLLLGGLGLVMVFLFLPKSGGGLDSRMFFLGAAFMLLETRAVVQLALLFGSTWIVNSLVFFTVLLLILLANLYVLTRPSKRVWPHYAALIAFLLVAALVPMTGFLGDGFLWRLAMPCFLTLGPVFFAGVIFTRSFARTANPDLAFGSNVAGAVVGGLAESLSMLLGFRYLLLLAVLFYLLSAWQPSNGTRATVPAKA
jgi:spermidine synthase